MDEAPTAPPSPHVDPTGLISDPSPRTAPRHLVEILAQVIPVNPHMFGPPGTETHHVAAMAQAQGYADRIWMEAWHAGAVWGTARAPFTAAFPVADLHPDFLEVMVQRARDAKEQKAAAG